MATPRASAFWAGSNRDDTCDGSEAEQQHMIDESYDVMGEDDGRTALDKTIDRIGMGM